MRCMPERLFLTREWKVDCHFTSLQIFSEQFQTLSVTLELPTLSSLPPTVTMIPTSCTVRNTLHYCSSHRKIQTLIPLTIPLKLFSLLLLKLPCFRNAPCQEDFLLNYFCVNEFFLGNQFSTVGNTEKCLLGHC